MSDDHKIVLLKKFGDLPLKEKVAVGVIALAIAGMGWTANEWRVGYKLDKAEFEKTSLEDTIKKLETQSTIKSNETIIKRHTLESLEARPQECPVKVCVQETNSSLSNLKTKDIVKPDIDKVLPKDLDARKIMDILYAREDPSDRKYTKLEYEGKYIHADGWEVIIEEKSSPSGNDGHSIDAVSNGVNITIFSNNDLMRSLSIGDKVKITGEIGGITSIFGESSKRDKIYIHAEEVSLIGQK